MKKLFKKKVWDIAKYVIAIIPLIWIFTRLDFYKFLATFPLIAWWSIPLLIFMLLISMTLQGVRWWMMMRALVPDLSFNRTIAYHFLGIFYSIVMPGGTVAQDVFKTVLLSKNVDYAKVWGATWICRILGLVALAIISIYGLLTVPTAFLPRGFLSGLFIVFGVCIVLVIVSFSKRFTRPVNTILRRFVPAKFFAIPEKIRDGIYNYRHKKRALLAVFAVTLITQFALIMGACVLIWGISGRFVLAETLAFIPIIEVVANSVLIVPNGMGVREFLTAIMFKWIGLSNEILGVYLVITVFFTVAIRLVGGVFVVHGIIKNRLVKNESVKNEILESGRGSAP